MPPHHIIFILVIAASKGFHYTCYRMLRIANNEKTLVFYKKFRNTFDSSCSFKYFKLLHETPFSKTEDLLPYLNTISVLNQFCQNIKKGHRSMLRIFARSYHKFNERIQKNIIRNFVCLKYNPNELFIFVQVFLYRFLSDLHHWILQTHTTHRTVTIDDSRYSRSNN